MSASTRLLLALIVSQRRFGDGASTASRCCFNRFSMRTPSRFCVQSGLAPCCGALVIKNQRARSFSHLLRPLTSPCVSSFRLKHRIPPKSSLPFYPRATRLCEPLCVPRLGITCKLTSRKNQMRALSGHFPSCNWCAQRTRLRGPRHTIVFTRVTLFTRGPRCPPST